MKPYSDLVTAVKSEKPIVYLVEISGVFDGAGNSLPAPIRLSNIPYTTKISDTPSNTTYLPIISGGLEFSASVSLDGGVSSGYGDLELSNINGEYDTYLTYIWTNRTIEFFAGELDWSREDMYKIFSGTVVDISSRDKDHLNIIIGDKLQKLNVPISEKELTSAISQNNILIPLTLGECFNITPISTDSIPNTLEYKYSINASNGVIEVRDNGVPVPFTANNANSTFTLNQAPYGQITCSVKGFIGTSLGYTNTVPGLIRTIITDSVLGTNTSQATLSTEEITGFTNFNNNYPQPVGVYCASRENILDICNNLAKSINAALTTTFTGHYRLILLDAPEQVKLTGLFPHHIISESDIIDQTLSISEKPAVVGTEKIAYCKNWTVQDSGLASGLPTSSVSLLKSEWLYSVVENAQAISRYQLDSEPIVTDTLLLREIDATGLANRRSASNSVARYIYTFECLAENLHISLGDTIDLIHSRFGLENGKTGLVVSISKNWIGGRIIIGVLI